MIPKRGSGNMLQELKGYLLILIVVMSSGCSTKYTKEPTIEKSYDMTTTSDHFIFIDNEGIMRDVNNKKIFKHEQSIKDIFKKFDSLKKIDNDLSIVIYIHGGLNKFDDTINRVENTYKRILANKQYPIFISWESGPLTNYSDHLFAIRNGERDLLKAIPSSPFILIEDALRSIARIPASSWNIIGGQTNVSISILTDEEKNAYKSEYRIDNNTSMHVHSDSQSTGHDFFDFATIINPTKFVTAPFIDGLGKGAWRSMLRRSDLILHSQEAYEGKGENGGKTAAYDFLDRLNKEYHDTNKTLIGHSMGTIVANNILIRFPDLNFNTVVYMAAACKIKDLEQSVVPWLKKDDNRTFYNLTLNPYRDINENSFYDFFPRGSLLVWIDDFLEDVNSFEDRTAGYWFNIVRSAEVVFPKDIRNQVHLTKFGIKDCSPQNHGEFDDFTFWKQNFWLNNESEIKSIIQNKQYCQTY